MSKSSEKTPPMAAPDMPRRKTEVMSDGEAPRAREPAPPANANQDSRYAIDREFARGGMARVLAAHDKKLNREVAIKELTQAGVDMEQRFRTESMITARLQHPSIVPIYDAGRWPSGTPYYAMKLVKGSDLESRIGDAGDLRKRLALVPVVIDAADAVAYAHSEGVIHRDIKPSNILVGRYGETLMIDWGLAKFVEAKEIRPTSTGDLSVRPTETIEGAIMGTPVYMPPEQARGEDVDRRADVYALGAVLYHVLTGRPPYDGDTARDTLEQVLQRAPCPANRLEPSIPQDLLAIVEKAMHRDPGARYQDAEALARDLHRFETGQLVSARQYNRRERMRRWASRHKQGVSVTLIAVTTLAILGALSVQRIIFERDAAETARKQVRAEHGALILEYARSALFSDPTASISRLRESAAQVPATADIAADAWSRGVARFTSRAHTDRVQHLHVFPSHRHAVTATDRGDIRVWSLETGASTSLANGMGAIQALAIGPDEKTVAAVFQHAGGRVWYLDNGLYADLSTDEKLFGLAFQDGQTLVASGAGGAVHGFSIAGTPKDLPIGRFARESALRRLPDGALVGAAVDGTLRIVHGQRDQVIDSGGPLVGPVAPDPTGTRLLYRTDRAMYLYDREAQRERELGAAAATSDFAIDPHGRWFARATPDSPLELVTTRTGRALAQLTSRHAKGVQAVTFSPDGRRVAAAAEGNDVKIWGIVGMDHAPTVVPLHHFKGHRAPVTRLEFAGEDVLVSASSDGELRIWDTRRVARPVDHEHMQIAFDTTCTAMSHSSSGILHSWSPDAGPPSVIAGPLHAKNHTLQVSANDPTGTAGLIDASGVARLFDRFTGAEKTAGQPESVRFLAISPDGAQVAMVARDGRLLLRSTATGDTRSLGTVPRATGLAFSPDGAHLAVIDRSGRLSTAGPGQREPVALFKTDRPLTQLKYAPNGEHIVAFDQSGTVHVVPTERSSAPTTFRAHEPSATAFTSDSTTLAIASGTGRIDILGPAGQYTGLTGHDGTIPALAFDPTGRQLVSGGADGTLRIWDVETGHARLIRLYAAISDLCILPDGDIAVATTKGVLYTVGRDDRELPWLGPGGLPRWLARLTTER